MTAGMAPSSQSQRLSASKRTQTRSVRLERLRAGFDNDPVFAHLRYQSRMVGGQGSIHPRLVFVVESPTKQDVTMKRYLSGQEQVVLSEALKTMDLPADQTYFTSVLKYATPQDRCGRPEELASGMKYLNAELDLLKPRVVVVFGRHLNEWMFPGVDLIHEHGWIIEGQKRVYVPMFHPHAALRNASIRKALMRDMGRLASLV